MPETICAADLLCHSCCSPDARRAAGDLMQALAAVECLVAVGGPAVVPDALLHDLVAITADLAGRDCLKGSGEPDDMLAAQQSPPLPELDQFLARALTSRFHLAPAPVPVPA